MLVTIIGINRLRNYLLVLCLVSSLSGCFDTEVPDRDLPMQRAVLSLPASVKIEEYKHFKFEGKKEDVRRLLLNFNELVNQTDLSAVSIECESLDMCRFVLTHKELRLSSGMLYLLPEAISDEDLEHFNNQELEYLKY